MRLIIALNTPPFILLCILSYSPTCALSCILSYILSYAPPYTLLHISLYINHGQVKSDL